jgi:uncharacterized protein (TIGR00725 family)
MIYIAVVGGADCTGEEYDLAYSVGQEVARKNAVVICGGGSGVMEAVSKGTTKAGGSAIGILPGEKADQGNVYLTFVIATGMGEARNAIIVRTADAVIAVGGEYGTLSEIALALKMGKPVIGLKSWHLKPPHKPDISITAAESAEAAVEKAFSLINS